MCHKYIHDSIHKQIKVHPIVLKIINTPPFQRLRYLKQLSMTEFVFPTASHNRLEHSIGVCYLAGKMIRSIREKQPELNITDNDILKVEIAGLCHDLGHGPYSHTFDKFLEKHHIDSTHESRSCQLLNHIVNKYQIPLTSQMLTDIQDLINPSTDTINHKNKLFMYHIISNPYNGIDVDKFDYLKRDAYNLGLSSTIDLERLIESARVIDNFICYPEKMVFGISSVFEIRGRLHKEVYTHPVSSAVEMMVMDMLQEMDIDWQTVINDPEQFIKLTDNIINCFPDTNVEANKIRDRIWNRDIYKYVEQLLVPKNLYNQIDDIVKQFIYLYEHDDVIIDMITIGYSKSPLKNVRFYNSKQNMDKSYLLDETKISPLLPNDYMDKTIRFYAKDKKKVIIGECILAKFKQFLAKFEVSNLTSDISIT